MKLTNTFKIAPSKNSIKDLSKNLVKNLIKSGQEYLKDLDIFWSIKDLT